MENLAERLFCDLKNDGIKIKYLYVVGAKIEYQNIHQF